MFCESELGHNASVDATKNICGATSEGAVDHSTVKQMVEDILLRLQGRSGLVR